MIWIPDHVTVELAVPSPRPGLDAVKAGMWLRLRRKALGLSAQDVVDATGMPRVQYLSHLERGVVHPAHSQYWPALQRALELTASDAAMIEGRKAGVTTGPDVRYPLPIRAAAEGTGARAYLVERDVLVVDHEQRELEVGREYLALAGDRVVRGRAVDVGGRQLLVNDRTVADIQVLGRVVHVGHTI
ncbi:helix-turn-helix transcriptional regulator [Deinococcus sp. KSM4-11]|nr:helix-turn-helix transcriptional regulator [Deinococcus sp. KSM4-11]